ncbi:MAG: hypothetical protein Q7T89_18330 [Anaerolineales bacterium]|nr:hypothetical protein [Anaerolineales bacterium]
MLMQHGKQGIVLFLLFVVLFILACGLSVAPNTSSPPAFDPTKAALELQATSMSLQLTQAALNSQPSAQPTSPPPEPTISQPDAPTQVQPTPTADVEARIRSANVLVYENTDEYGIGMWIQDALDGMGIKYTQTGSYSGHFMEYLNSGAKYDLIIVGAEAKDRISGEFWDVINTRLTRDKVALIVEVWYLDTESSGPISKILSGCGIRYQKDYSLADSIYWWDPTHPIFNEPNTVLPLLHYNRYWQNQTGDQIRLGGSGDAELLAGLAAKKSNQEGVLATCYDGRVIIQTFSDHDYDQADILPLWENYIHYTLKNHFLAVP